MKILIVDDEKELCKALSSVMEKRNFPCDVAFDGESGLDMALSGIYDIIVLDIMLPKLNGYEIVKTLRKEKISTPVIFLSAKSQTADKIEGLNCGADDYLSKPFETAELIARIKALLRRKNEFIGDTLSFGDITLNRDNCSIICGKKDMPLSKKEFGLLEALILSGEKAVNKERLIEKIWGYDNESEYNAIEVYVSFIRKKLTALNSKVNVKSLRGIGYILECEK